VLYKCAFNSESMAKLAELPYPDSHSSLFEGISLLVHKFVEGLPHRSTHPGGRPCSRVLSL
jgi:hypothetical protein